MSKKKPETALTNNQQIDEYSLFVHVAEIIETRKTRAGAYANREVTLMYWEVGRYVNSVVLDGERAKYGKQIVATLAAQLAEKYGNSFEYTKLTRMIKFAELFPDAEIVATLSQQLSWSHFIEILPLNCITHRTPQRDGWAFVSYAVKSPIRLMNDRKSPTPH